MGHPRTTLQPLVDSPEAFPGELGAFGSWLFGVGFLERDYAAMMKGVRAERAKPEGLAYLNATAKAKSRSLRDDKQKGNCNGKDR